MTGKDIFWKIIRFLLKLIWKLFLLCLWMCLRAIEFLARVLGDWAKQLLTPNDRRNDNYRRTP